MSLSIRLTLSQQLMILTVALVLTVQIANVIVARVSDVKRVHSMMEGRILDTAARQMSVVVALPAEQRADYTFAAGSITRRLEWGTPRPYFEGDIRHTDAEAEALTLFQEMGLPVDEVILTKRRHPAPFRAKGPEAERSIFARFGERPRVTVSNRTLERRERLPLYLKTDIETPPERLIDLFRFEPPAEVQRLALRHEGTDDWLTLYALLRPNSLNPYITKFVTSTLISLSLAAVFFVIGRRVMRPLRRLSQEAERLGRGETVSVLAIEGPSDTREIIASFNRMNERVTQAVDHQIGLLRSLAHDLQGPLVGVKGLIASVSPGRTRDQIETRLGRAKSIVDAIMSFSRSVMRDGDFQLVDLSQLLEVVVDDRVEAGDDAALEDVETVMVTCRVNAIQRCLNNLVENACKYGSRARASVRRDGDEAVIFVDDIGPGIPDEDLERVFLPFERLEHSLPGSGLGLAIVKTIVLDQGGTVRLVNRDSGGLRAELRLPLERDT